MNAQEKYTELLRNLHGMQCALFNFVSEQHREVLAQAYNAISKLSDEVDRFYSQETVKPPKIISGKVKNPGLYGSVNLNGWILVSDEKPARNRAVLIGYRVPHLPEIWYGVGYRDAGQQDSDRYWLGPRALDPHYCQIGADQVVIWRAFEQPVCFDEDKPGTSDYLQWRYILGEEETPNANVTDRSHGNASGTRTLRIEPDTLIDFRALPFPDGAFNLVSFDPPHLVRAGPRSWLAAKYGKLGQDWRDDLRAGFAECFRVLATDGVLVFKWNETHVRVSEVLALTPVQPLFGHISGRKGLTHWLVFMSPNV